MTSLELLAALVRRYDITNPNLENLPDSILLAIQHDEHDALKYKQAVSSLAHRAQIILEPLDTFAARAHDAIRAKAACADGNLTSLAHEVHTMLPGGYKAPWAADRYTVTEILQNVRSFLQTYGASGTYPVRDLTDLAEYLSKRYSLSLTPLDTLPRRVLQHVAQMERDAAEAHSAAKALGVEVKDLADMAKTLRRSETTAATVAADARDSLAKVEAKLQAINEALPPDLRHSDDLAAAVRSLVLTAETRYGQWDELAKETAPAVQTVAALRYALESRSMRLALARELYDADDNLLGLLETADAHQMTEALLATLATNHAAPEYPPLPKPSALARTLEGPAKVAYFNHSRRAGRIEAIGGDLIRFYPVEGDPVTLNATRRDLEVYMISADELATEIARVEARKTSPATTPPDAPAPDAVADNLPF